MPTAEPVRISDSPETFLISYAGFNRPWATWIADQLEDLGHEASLQRWDPPLTTSLARALQDLLAAQGRVLLVLDDWYFTLGPRTAEEWDDALRAVIHPNSDRFAAVTVATRALPTAAAPLRAVDLRDLAVTEARRSILRRLGLNPSSPSRPDADTSGPRFPNNPPVVRDIPRRNSRFTGRDVILEHLHDRFATGGQFGTHCALFGLSGVGKSQIGIEYAHRFGNDYDIVWSINAASRATAREQLATLADPLGLQVGDELGSRIRAVQEALRIGKPYRRWLLVIDGADEPDQIQDLVPEGQGHVLITTRSTGWASEGAEQIEVGPFRRPESIAFTRRSAPRLTVSEADALAEAVQDLPLLLAQTSAWLDVNPIMQVTEYVGRIRSGETERFEIETSEDYPKGFQTTWAITLNTLRSRNPAAAELLKLFAFFYPDAIPVRMVQSARAGDLPDPLADLAADPNSWHTALRSLREFAMVRLNYQQSQTATGQAESPAVETVQMHRLYHAFVRSELPEEEKELMAATACRVLAAADPRRPTEPREWPRYAELIPHLTASGALDSTDPAVRELVLNCIEYLRVRGEYRDGLELCESVLERWRPNLAPDDRSLLIAIHQFAGMLRRSGRYQEAELVNRDVVEQLAAVRDAQNVDLLRAKNGLGGALLALGHYEEARGLFEEIWQAFLTIVGPEDPRTLQARNNLAEALGLVGRYQEALLTHREILHVRERVMGPRAQLTLSSGMRYAWMQRLLGNYRGAQSRQELNAHEHREVLGRFHVETLRAELNLALCLRRQGDLTATKDLMKDILERSRRIHGSKHPETVRVTAYYATFVREHGNLEEAHGLAAEAADRFEELLGPAHPNSIGTRGNLGLALWELGEYDEALVVAERAFSGMTEALGKDHPWTLGCALNAAAGRIRTEDEERALELDRDTLARAKRMLGDAHPLTLSTKAAIAEDLRALRRNTEASKLYQEAVQQLSEALGRDHPHTRSVRSRERPYWDFEPQLI
ncbi:FxSxx-COOH system tetratricopeptide repeat protein [Streptomyces sp. NPDC059373]